MNVNLARFDLATIRLAVLCAELGSLSAASRRANCSLSSGSQRLKGLEDSLGLALFVRDHRGLHVTAAGELFMRHAKAILREMELMLDQTMVESSPEDSPCSSISIGPMPSHSIKPERTRMQIRGMNK